MSRSAAWSGLLCLVACGACSGWQSALDPQGAPADRLDTLIRIIVIVCLVVWLLVMAALGGALWRRRPAEGRPAPAPDSRDERHLTVAVAVALIATVAIISAFTLFSFFATRGLAGADPEALVVRVRGYQWWWQVTYVDARADRSFTTANELHIPVGRPVRVQLEAADVIHSFWVPNLAGKQDLVPGRENWLTLRAERPGVYRGQCAEFCGFQHAHMAFLVIAEEPAAFEAWRAAQIAPAATPAEDETRAGEEAFVGKACASCHTIRGTPAAGNRGPDLTHVASRRYIAAGLFETTRGSLAAWIADPQTPKPGNTMPMVDLSPDDLRAISAYLASLK